MHGLGGGGGVFGRLGNGVEHLAPAVALQRAHPAGQACGLWRALEHVLVDGRNEGGVGQCVAIAAGELRRSHKLRGDLAHAGAFAGNVAPKRQAFVVNGATKSGVVQPHQRGQGGALKLGRVVQRGGHLGAGGKAGV